MIGPVLYILVALAVSFGFEFFTSEDDDVLAGMIGALWLPLLSAGVILLPFYLAAKLGRRLLG